MSVRAGRPARAACVNRAAAMGCQPVGHYVSYGAGNICTAVIFQVEYEPALVKSVFHTGGGGIQVRGTAQAAAFGFQIYDDVSPSDTVYAVITDAVAPCAVHRLAAAQAVGGQRKYQLQSCLGHSRQNIVPVVQIVHFNPPLNQNFNSIYLHYNSFMYMLQVFSFYFIQRSDPIIR